MQVRKIMKIIKITDEAITFNDGTEITHNHDQDCCENVYADFRSLKDQDIKQKEIKRISIVGVKDAGFRLNGYFIPCYNSQNGYYSDNLELIITYPNGDKLVKNLAGFIEDQID